MRIIINHPKAMLECIYPRSLFLFQSLTCIRQSQNQSLIFFAIILGFRNERKNFFLSSRGSSMIILPALIRHQQSTNDIPIMKGVTKLSNPDGYSSLISFPPLPYISCLQSESDDGY